MINRFRVSAVVLAAVAGSMAASASADVIYTLSYHDLAGSYTQSANPLVGSFSAVAVNNANLQSAYEASRLDPAPTGQAEFEAGFVSNPLNPADFQINVSVIKISGTVATGTGDFTATDRDGDVINGRISGVWTTAGGFLFFNGNLSNVRLNDNNAADGTFDGTEQGDFSILHPAPQPFVGSNVQLTFGIGNFFRTDFSDRATGGTMQIIPSPGSMALLGLGGLAIASRRRGR